VIKLDIVNAVVSRTGVTRTKAEQAVETVFEAMKNALGRGERIELRSAANGREALQLLETFSPDLVLLDLLMPEMDGMSFLDLLRRDPRHENLPVFIVTAKELDPQEKQRLSRLAQAVLKKAEDLGTDLRRVLHAQLNKDGLARTSNS